MKMHDYRLLQLLSIVQVITITDYNIPMSGGWSGGAMVLGKLPVPGRPTI